MYKNIPYPSSASVQRPLSTLLTVYWRSKWRTEAHFQEFLLHFNPEKAWERRCNSGQSSIVSVIIDINTCLLLPEFPRVYYEQ